MSPILDAMSVNLVFDSGQIYGGRAYRDCITAAHAHGISVVLFSRAVGCTCPMMALHSTFLSPSIPFLSDTGDDVP
jgi:hypothetical protein